jgi:apolipoprotein D and lipocalin family protein
MVIIGFSMLIRTISTPLYGAPSRKYLWILSRQPQMDPLLLAGLLGKVRSLGYDPNRLILAK